MVMYCAPFLSHKKEQFIKHEQMNHYLLTLISFQTFLTEILLWNTKQDILKTIEWKSVGSKATLGPTHLPL